MRVQVGQDHRKAGLRGAPGTVRQAWTGPNYSTALLVRLEYGRYEFFWLDELQMPDEDPGEKPNPN